MRTPSYGINQNQEDTFIDKYWGRVPKYLHIIPETIYTDNPIFMCNPEYIELMEGYMDGSIVKENLSQELWYDIENTINKIPSYGAVPNPLLDPLFSCIYGEPDPSDRCGFMVDKNCSPIVTGDGCFMALPPTDIWEYLYYADADPAAYRIIVFDPVTMLEIGSIPTIGENPHSVDRVCQTDKMYARTQNTYGFDVLDARTLTPIKNVSLPFRPRTCGDQNLYLNLQLVAGTSDPMISVIDIFNDNILFTGGKYKVTGQVPTGNQGGSASGHPAWLDSRHFTILDRLNDKLVTYRLTPTENPLARFTFTKTQELDIPTAMHTIQGDFIDTELREKIFYGSLEGSESLGIQPSVVELLYNGFGHLTIGRTTILPGTTTDDAQHHATLTDDRSEIWATTFKSKKVWVIDPVTMAVTKEYDGVGFGAGHINFSYEHRRVCITNHFDNFVSILDMDSEDIFNVTVSAEPADDAFLQTHSNWVLRDGNFFYLGLAVEGKFVEIDISGPLLTDCFISRELITGGHPEQSIS